MNRRELLTKSAMAAGAVASVAALPEMLSIPAASLTAVPWTETKLTAAHQAIVEPLVKQLIAGKTVSSLTGAEWNALATSHHMYLTLHAGAGDMAKVDAAIAANQVYLKTKFNPSAVNYVVAHGSYELLSHMSGSLILCRDKTESGLLSPLNAPMNWQCALFWVFSAAAWGMIGLLVPEIAIFCYIMDVGTGTFGAFSCA